MELFKFPKRNQGQTETISDFITAIKKLSGHYSFGYTLKAALRDRFVCGLRDVNINQRLLQEQNLTLDTATNLSLAMEMAQKDAVEMQGQPMSSQPAMHAMKTKQFKRPAIKNFPPCPLCGKTNHKRSDCFHKESTCNHCHKKTHLQTVCR
ncbi:histone-lysine N-methyltransferase SETMAR-like [Plakobranchus ocellatus]|uniref:Histone-lysine N-methyltransferase SETMAR-like n=1 Tax=Plakobranchus ocellatus TaxID=259542 RepID=A0AAV4A6S1_9GAST|nr:histone-lysine N-methyltransferase SETMAR-like [Plakobranchus ocellatus]